MVTTRLTQVIFSSNGMAASFLRLLVMSAEMFDKRSVKQRRHHVK